MRVLRCYITPNHDLFHLSLAVTGLLELAAAGEIELKFGEERPGRETPADASVLEFELETEDYDTGSPVERAFSVRIRARNRRASARRRCGGCFRLE